jgi:hypothetical protein
MTLGPRKEHPMKAKPERQSPVDIARFRKEAGLRIERLVAESLEAWPTCENRRCRRLKRCASRHYECLARWRESLPPLSPEERAERRDEFRIAVDARRRLGREATAEQLTEAIEREKALRRAALPPQVAEPPAPAAEETQLAPEQQARIDRAWNEYVEAQPAEQDLRRERGPRITPL